MSLALIWCQWIYFSCTLLWLSLQSRIMVYKTWNSKYPSVSVRYFWVQPAFSWVRKKKQNQKQAPLKTNNRHGKFKWWDHFYFFSVILFDIYLVLEPSAGKYLNEVIWESYVEHICIYTYIYLYVCVCVNEGFIPTLQNKLLWKKDKYKSPNLLFYLHRFSGTLFLTCR